MLILVQLLSAHKDELEADFQQFYGLDLGGMGSDYSVAHAAVLASQLPPEARTYSAINPDLGWSPEMGVLVRIDYWMQCILAVLGGMKGSFRPRQIKSPGERAHIKEQLEKAETDMADVASILGIGGEDG